jgi:hypothetical protein
MSHIVEIGSWIKAKETEAAASRRSAGSFMGIRRILGTGRSFPILISKAVVGFSL